MHIDEKGSRFSTYGTSTKPEYISNGCFCHRVGLSSQPPSSSRSLPHAETFMRFCSDEPLISSPADVK